MTLKTASGDVEGRGLWALMGCPPRRQLPHTGEWGGGGWDRGGWCGSPEVLAQDQKRPSTRWPPAVTQGTQALEPLGSDACLDTLSTTSLDLSFLICETGASGLLYRVDGQVVRNSLSRAPGLGAGRSSSLPRRAGEEEKEGDGSPNLGRRGAEEGEDLLLLVWPEDRQLAKP